MAIQNRNLAVGTRLVARYKGKEYLATVVEGDHGNVHFRLEDGREFNSPSAAGTAVMGGISCNGWRFWSVAGEGFMRQPVGIRQPSPASEKVTVPAPGEAPGAPTLSQLIEADHRAIRQGLKKKVLALDDTQFEHLCRHLLEALGFSDVKVTGRSHDKGIDGEGLLSIMGLKVAFQAKKYKEGDNIGGQRMAEFRGSIQGKYERGIYITTDLFTLEAWELAAQADGVTIIFFDGERLVDIMMEKGLGINTRPLTLPRLDDEFFMKF